MRILISAGPMRTYIDPIRYIQNSSSGVLGLEIAKALKKNDSSSQITTLLGPVDSSVAKEFSANSDVHHYITAHDYEALLKKHFLTCDLFISCSAVLDFDIETEAKKISRTDLEASDELRFHKRNVTDFVALVSKTLKQAHQRVFAFSLDTGDESAAIAKAQTKITAKHVEAIFVNFASSNEGPDKPLSGGVILNQSGQIVRRIAQMSKRDVAKEIVDFLGSDLFQADRTKGDLK